MRFFFRMLSDSVNASTKYVTTFCIVHPCMFLWRCSIGLCDVILWVNSRFKCITSVLFLFSDFRVSHFNLMWRSDVGGRGGGRRLTFLTVLFSSVGISNFRIRIFLLSSCSLSLTLCEFIKAFDDHRLRRNANLQLFCNFFYSEIPTEKNYIKYPILHCFSSTNYHFSLPLSLPTSLFSLFNRNYHK